MRPLSIPQAHQIGPLLGGYRGGGFLLSMSVEDSHCNLAGNLSGGVTATLFDIAMGLACCADSSELHPLPTISMTIDYIRPIRRGAEPLLKASMTRRTGTLGFSEAQLFDGDDVCARATGLFRMPKPGQPGFGPIEMIFARPGGHE